VAIYNFNVRRPCRSPSKANAPLIINSDAVLPLSVACERFKVISGRRLQEVKRCSRLKLRE
jgi:hypothetical protein